MAKKYRMLRAGLTVDQVASFVISQYINEARANLGTWANNYQAGINRYLNDAQRQNLARQKLSNWYNALQTVIPQIVAAFTQAKSTYAGRRAIAVTPPPA
jgi:hypothetical protein